MKLTGIKIKDYYQFKDVYIDLTYPTGHEKEGQPLDKVCFLGQGGTGKTTLLRLIKWFISGKREIGKNLKLPIPSDDSIQMDFRLSDGLTYRVVNREVNAEHDIYLYYEPQNKKMTMERFFDHLVRYYEESSPVLINFPTELLWGQNPPEPVSGSPVDVFQKMKMQEKAPALPVKQSVIDFAAADVREYWQGILQSIEDYRSKVLVKNSEFADAALKTGKAAKKQTDAFKRWLEENPSPMDTLADKCLDPLLSQLGLKVKRELDEQTVRNISFIALQTLAGRDVPYGFWSTGTRQLVQTILPLFQLAPKNAVILVDEPERSLYPDLQRQIIETYIEQVKGSQFFFATHSPVITSAFEPWEIVELKFDKERNYVYRENKYKGDNKVDNYEDFPEFMRWDSILMQIFDLEEEGSEKRIKALENLTDLEAQIDHLKEINKWNAPENKKLKDKYLELLRKLGWITREDD